MDTKTQEYFVMKEIDVSEMPEDEVKDCKKEVQILAKMNHPNITAYKRSFLKRGYLVIVMEYADGGDLNMLIRKRRKMKKYFSENQVLDWFTQVCLAVKHIHDKKILHRDLKTQNVFLTAEGIVKLGDFGISRVLDNTMGQAITMVGTPYYLSPEIVSNKPYGRKSDIWALGVCLYEMLTLKVPFTADSLPELAERIQSGEYSPIPKHYSEECRALLRNLLNVDPSKRPSVDDILQDVAVRDRVARFPVDINEETGDAAEEHKEDHVIDGNGQGSLAQDGENLASPDEEDKEEDEDVAAQSSDDNNVQEQQHHKTLRDVQKEHQKQGWLVKRSRHIRKWRRRYVVLKDGAIFTFRSDHDKDANATEKIDLASFNIVTDATFKKHPHTFNVSSGSRTFSFECVSKAEKDSWKESIQEAVDVLRAS